MCLKKTIPCILIALGCVHFSYAKTDTKCGGRLDWNNDVTIPKDDDGNYQRNLQCIFQTTFRDIDPNVLLLKWFSFDIAGEMERCSDYVEIYVSCSYKSLGRFCGNNPPSDIISPDRCMKLEFHSSGKASSRRGFRARLIVTAEVKSLSPHHNSRYSVKLNASTGSGIISSPGYPIYYPVSRTSQTVVFEAHQGKTTMRLYFMDFNIRGPKYGKCKTSSDDILKIEVFRASDDVTTREVLTLCGARKPFVVTWRDFWNIKIKFLTNNDSRVARGYVAGYMIYKTGKHVTNNAVGIAHAWPLTLALHFIAYAAVEF